MTGGASPHVIENADGTVSYRCPLCGGCSHPATGCVYTPTFVVCWRCTLEACAWIRTWTASKGRRQGPDFYGSVKFDTARELPAKPGV